LLAISCLAAGSPDMNIINAEAVIDIPTASGGRAATNAIPLYGFADAIAIDYTFVSGAYAATNTGSATDPSIVGGYFPRASFGVSTNAYTEDGGVYNLWFTNGQWHVGGTIGLTNDTWTNNLTTVTGLYTNNSAAKTGSFTIVALYADFDVDVKTIDSVGIGMARTLYSADDVDATDVVKYIRPIADTTAGDTISNSPLRMPLVADKVEINLSDSFSTGITAKAYIILAPAP